MSSSEGLMVFSSFYDRLMVLWCRPERWFDLPPAVQSIPGVTNGLLAFLNGSRSCIGYRFALAECVDLPAFFRAQSLTTE